MWLSLFRESFGQTYTYDKDNNVIAVTDLQNQKQKFEYNDNLDMTGVTDAKENVSLSIPKKTYASWKN